MKGWKKGVKKELICYVTRFLIHSPFTLVVDILLSLVMIPPNHLDKKSTGLLTTSMPALHISYQEGRALLCSYADESSLRPCSVPYPKGKIYLSWPLQGSYLGFLLFSYRLCLSKSRGRVGPHRQELMVYPGWFIQDLGVSPGHGIVSAKMGTDLGKPGRVGHTRGESCQNFGESQGNSLMFSK